MHTPVGGYSVAQARVDRMIAPAVLPAQASALSTVLSSPRLQDDLKCSL